MYFRHSRMHSRLLNPCCVNLRHLRTWSEAGFVLRNDQKDGGHECFQRKEERGVDSKMRKTEETRQPDRDEYQWNLCAFHHPQADDCGPKNGEDKDAQHAPSMTRRVVLPSRTGWRLTRLLAPASSVLPKEVISQRFQRHGFAFERFECCERFRGQFLSNRPRFFQADDGLGKLPLAVMLSVRFNQFREDFLTRRTPRSAQRNAEANFLCGLCG